MSWVDGEFVLVTLATMLSPLTLIWSVLALVLSKRPLYTGGWFYLGGLAATLGIGIAAAIVLGNAAASHHSSTPKTWVAILDVIGGVLLVVWVVRLLRRPADPQKTASMMERMRKIASSPWIAVLGAGAVLANPGVFVPFALKVVSETDPSRGEYFVEWTVYTVLGLLPLAIAIVLLVVARTWTEGVLDRARGWLVLHARIIGAVLVLALAASLLRGGIAGLTS